MIGTILLLGLSAAVAEILGGGIVILRKSWPQRVQEVLLALSAGFLLALVLLEMAPEAIAAVGHGASLYLLAGYAVIHFFEHTIVGHLHFGEETHREVMVSRVAGLATIAGLFVHAFFDGFAISAAMLYDPSLGLLVFVAVILHKFPEGLTTASVMVAAGHGRKTALLASLAIGLATMLGVLSVFLLQDVDAQVLGRAFAFSGGVALYVGASDLIPEINHSRNRVIPLLVFAGMLLFAVASALLHDHMR